MKVCIPQYRPEDKPAEIVVEETPEVDHNIHDLAETLPAFQEYEREQRSLTFGDY